MQEVGLLERKPIPGVRPVPGTDSNPLEWKLYLTGPAEYNVGGARRKCPYGGRVFEATVKYPASYPFTHPEVRDSAPACRVGATSFADVSFRQAAGCHFDGTAAENVAKEQMSREALAAGCVCTGCHACRMRPWCLSSCARQSRYRRLLTP